MNLGQLDPLFIFLILVFVIVVGTVASYFGDLFSTQLQFFYDTYPFWLPIVLGFVFWFVWIDYIRSNAIHKWQYAVLEIFLPRDVFKSPLAMELALAGFHITTGESNWFDIYVLGKTRTTWSLEIASIEGTLHFYIWTRAGLKPVVESQLYGQYPGIEIVEVPDYTNIRPRFDSRLRVIWGNEFKLLKPDPYPIKTYVDYGLEKDPKEEFKVDPLTSVLEFMASIGKGEQMWLQFVIRSHKKKHKKGTLFGQTDWREEGKELIKKLLDELREEQASQFEGGFSYMRIPTKGEAELLAAIDRSTSKIGFDTGCRLIYYTPDKEKFIGARIPGILNLMKPYNTNNLNGFSPTNYTGFDYPWQDLYQVRENIRSRKILEHYRRRAFFHAPYRKNVFVLNSEELATVYHFPGGVLQAPTVSRVLSKKVEPPGNLPR